ncbi:MAG TPA: hypothetical protein DHW81_01525 [Nitrospiraceae bacterium]|nr:MAG: hypothetical protein A2Z82_02570 [Nitrospirae bacterium GWA2_46_11]OGW23115.1 MAG: hypothetical protein A2X55_09070 [Nitrospirae bacterium GWB2_47_37]HAK87662.1 hypothetical protein [Nitrospiraceae bacterium]HCL80941.1 hypothetical protein [Nitrospiraceae bacterium]
MIRFDYLNKDKTVLSSDGRRPDIKILKGFNDKFLTHLGNTGRLKGAAFEDYMKIAQDGRADMPAAQKGLNK